VFQRFRRAGSGFRHAGILYDSEISYVMAGRYSSAPNPPGDFFDRSALEAGFAASGPSIHLVWGAGLTTSASGISLATAKAARSRRGALQPCVRGSSRALEQSFDSLSDFDPISGRRSAAVDVLLLPESTDIRQG
jgi:hypothetical protein